MLLPVLLLASQAVDHADKLNASLTTCLFATAREAASRDESVAQFRVTLERSCLDEEARARDAIVSILVHRGQRRATAEAKIDETLRYGRAAVIRAYSFSPPSRR